MIRFIISIFFSIVSEEIIAHSSPFVFFISSSFDSTVFPLSSFVFLLTPCFYDFSPLSLFLFVSSLLFRLAVLFFLILLLACLSYQFFLFYLFHVYFFTFLSCSPLFHPPTACSLPSSLYPPSWLSLLPFTSLLTASFSSSFHLSNLTLFHSRSSFFIPFPRLLSFLLPSFHSFMHCLTLSVNLISACVSYHSAYHGVRYADKVNPSHQGRLFEDPIHK